MTSSSTTALAWRLGIVTPVVTLVPGAHADWERTAGPDELGQVAEAADRLGFASLTCSEHVAVPVDVAAVRGGTYWDPLATLSWLAARTRRVRLATQVLVLGYHHPLEVAKRYGALDALSGGRLVLGVGVGSLEAEFDLLGASFADRGRRADDALRALRAALSQPEPSYADEFYSFDGVVVQPHAVQERVPLRVGGRTARSLRRAVELGDGWVPFGLGLTELGELLSTVELRPGFEVVLSARRPLDPLGDAEGAAAALRRVFAAGATTVDVTLQASSAGHWCDQLAALADLGELVPLGQDGA